MDGFSGLKLHRAQALRSLLAALSLGLMFALSGCTSQGGIKQAFGKTMQAVGLADSTAQERQVPLRLYAGDNLNAGSDRRALSLVVRVYQLRDIARFEEAPFDVFLDQQRERDVLGDDLIGVTEILLAPGQRHEVLERLSADGGHLGVVALFRAPAPTRWRFAFDTEAAAADGITVGLHACAMTTPSAGLETVLASPPHSLASSNCTPPPG